MNDISNLWQNHAEEIYNFIFKKVPNTSDAQDLRQEIFIKAYLHIHQLKEAEKARAWLFQITRRTITDFYRKLDYSEDLTEHTVVSDEQESPNLEQHLYCCLYPYIDELPAKYREAIVLHHVQGMKQEEIAKKLDVSFSGIKSRIQRGREIIKEKLSDCCGYHFGDDGKLHGEQDCAKCHAVL